ncbi:MAG: altronate dehydratase family protein [Propionibacteriaceae bacterium]|jgi:altronate hydrolase|nr:altronate dehydratase family protein [Propionibacteriaceae bacterium]
MPETIELSQAAIVLDPTDDVAVAKSDLAAGTVLSGPTGQLRLGQTVPGGHKLALRRLAAGRAVRKYGQAIGRASAPIEAGDWVHSHNLVWPPPDVPAGSPPAGSPGRPAAVEPPSVDRRRTFRGYQRADGRVGTRNLIAIVTSVNCAAATARMIADRFRDAAERFPGLDAVTPIVHNSGCGLAGAGPGTQILRRTLQGYARHPNVAGLVILGLGCEMMSLDLLQDGLDLPSDTLLERLVIQDCGGVRRTVAMGVELVNALAAQLARRRRREVPLAGLTLALNCGGSDAYSGLTANPALGWASDQLVAAGGRSVLAETPELHGAEGLLIERADDPADADWLVERMAWWERYVAAAGGSLDNNPSPGNKAGGLTTIGEKSMGAVAKAGRARLSAVYDYAAPIDRPGLGFMDTPGYDPVSVTGLVAGGANLIAFTTGRGSVFGSRVAPCLKLASNSALARRMSQDIDLDCGGLIERGESVEQVGRRVLDRLLEVASGAATVNEDLPIGVDEFVPWQLGAVV